MDWKIIVGAIGFGAGAEGLRQYRKWKSARRLQPAAVRNVGFWTDARLLWAETLIVFGFCAPIFAVLALFTFPSFWKAAAVLLAYAGFSFLLLRGLNRHEPGP